jgi:drug/metabolite transporter (DMT)-like permease
VSAADERIPGAFTINLVVALLCLIWGSTWLVIKEGLRDLPPFSSAGVRFLLAAALFTLIAPLLRGREGGERPPFWLILVMGVLNFTIPYGVVYWGETIIPSGLAAVLWAVFPMLVAVSGHFLLSGEQLVARHWLGFAFGFLGVVLLFLTDLREIGPAAIGAGAIFMLSPFSAAIGNTLVKRHGGRYSSLLLNRGGLSVAAVALCVVALATERGAPLAWTGTAVFSVLYLSVFGTVVTFGLYFWVLRYAAAYKLSLIAYIIPAIALLLGWALGDEAVTPQTVAGSALILVGIALVVRGRRRRDWSH